MEELKTPESWCSEYRRLWLSREDANLHKMLYRRGLLIACGGDKDKAVKIMNKVYEDAGN